MQADRTLVEGQYRAIASEALLGQAQHEGIMGIIKAIGDNLDFKKRKSGNYDDQMQQVIDNYGLPSQSEQQNITNTLAGPMQERYINGTPQEQQQILRQQMNMSEQEKKYHDIMNELALNYKHGGLNNNWKTTDTGRTIMEMAGKPNLTLDPVKGEDFGVNMPDFEVIKVAEEQLFNIDNEIDALESMYDQGGIYDDGQQLDDLYKQRQKLQETINAKPVKWYSMQQFESVVKQGEYDRGIATSYQDLLKSYKMKASNQKGESIDINMDEVNDTIWSGIISKGKYDSMVYNEMIPGRIFYRDLYNTILGKNVGGRTYKDFGITDAQLSDAAGADDKIDINEAKNLATAIVNSRETDGNGYTLGQRALQDYLAQGVKNQFKIGEKNTKNIDENKDEDKDKDEEKKLRNMFAGGEE